MKIFTLLMAGMVAVSASAAGPFSAKKKYVGVGLDYSAKELLENPELMKKAVKASPIWRNAELSMTEYILGEDIWSEPEVHYLQYDRKGNLTIDNMVIESEGIKSRTSYTYNENDKVLTKIDEVEAAPGEWEYVEKREYAYDNVLADYVTKSIYSIVDQSNLEDPWVISGGSFKKDVTRDDKNRLDGVTISTWFQAKWDPVQKYEIKFDEMINVPSEITHTELQYDTEKGYYWNLAGKYSYITWDRTDNQITDLDMANTFLVGNNRIKRAMFSNGEYDYVLKVTYEGSQDFTAVTTSGPDTETHILTTTDANGSFEESFETKSDENGDQIISEDEIYVRKRIVLYDEGGRIIEETRYEGGVLESSEKIAYTVDPSNGCVLQEERQAYFEADPTMGITESGYMPVMKVVYKNYFDVTTQGGVENVGSDNFSVKVLDDAVELSLSGMSGYAIYGINGAVAATGNLSGANATISTSNLANGVYMLRVNAESGVKVVKFVKK